MDPQVSGGKSAPFHGTLTEDASWQGEVWVDGDVIVPAGRTLTISPGASVHFLRKSQPDFQLRRPMGGFYRNLATSPAHSYILVEGKLECPGTPESAISFRSAPEAVWGGILLFNRGQAALFHTRFTGFLQGVKGIDLSSARIEHCEFLGGKVGIHCCGFGQARIMGARFKDNQFGLELIDDSSAALSSCEILGGKIAVKLDQMAKAEIKGTLIRGHSEAGVECAGASRLASSGNRFEQNGRGIDAAESSRITLEADIIESCGTIGLRATDECGVRVKKSRFDRNPNAGILASGEASLELEGSDFEGNLNGVVSNSRGRVTLARNHFSRNTSCGIRVNRGRALVKKNEFVDNANGVLCEGDSRTKCESNVLSRQSGNGFKCSGSSRAELERNTVVECGIGIYGMSQSEITSRKDVIEGSLNKGVLLQDQSGLRGEDTAIHHGLGEGAVAEGGASLFLRNCVLNGNKVGVRLQGGRDVRLEKNRIEANLGNGLVVLAGCPILSKNSIVSNEIGIVAAGSSRLRLSGDTLSFNRCQGLLARDSAHVIAAKIRADSNGSAGVESDNSSALTVGGSLIQKNGDGFVSRGGRTTIEGSILAENSGSGARLFAGHAEIRSCRIGCNNKGVWAGGRSTLIVDSSDVYQHPDAGVESTDDANAEVLKSAIYENRIGIHGRENGRISVKHTKISRCKIGMESMDASRISASQNVVAKNLFGCVTRPGSGVTDKDNVFEENEEDRFRLISPS